MSIVVSHPSPDFLRAQLGDYVVVCEDTPDCEVNYENHWIAQVIFVIGGARNACDNSLFQVVNVDTGIVKTINADLVKGVLIGN